MSSIFRRKSNIVAMRPIAEDKILRRGYLLKMGSIHKAWKLRWFVLEAGTLWYFKSPMALSKPQGCIELADTVIKPANLGSGKDFCFELVTKSRVFLLIARNRTFMQSWMWDLSRQTTHNRENALLLDAELMITRAEERKSEPETTEWDSLKVKGWGESLMRVKSVREAAVRAAMDEGGSRDSTPQRRYNGRAEADNEAETGEKTKGGGGKRSHEMNHRHKHGKRNEQVAVQGQVQVNDADYEGDPGLSSDGSDSGSDSDSSLSDSSESESESDSELSDDSGSGSGSESPGSIPPPADGDDETPP